MKKKTTGTKNETDYCLQCGAELLYEYVLDSYNLIPFCTVARCPNYGLLQIGSIGVKEVYDNTYGSKSEMKRVKTLKDEGR